MPHHLISHHTEHVRLSQVNTGHCVRAYYRRGTEEVDFCVCLTCRKGMMDVGTEGNGSRWITRHSKKTACVAAHPQAMRDLRARMSPVTATAPPLPPAPSTSLGDIWSKWKANGRTKPVMTDIEERCKSEFDDDSDNEGIAYTFDPKAGFEYCIFMAHSLKKENAEIKAKISQMERDHDYAVCEMQREIRELKAKLAAVSDNYNRLYKDHSDLSMRFTELEKENEVLKGET
jgi:hypothetical protein